MLTRWQVLSALLTLFVSSALGQQLHLPKFGACPNLTAQQKFISNIEKFVENQWYVQSSFDTEALQGRGKCMTASFKYNPFNQNVWISTGQYNLDSNYWERLDGNAIPQDASRDEGKYTVRFTVPIFGKVSGTYTVLSTDYETYSIMHGCGSFLNVLHYDCCWIMSKKQTMTAEEEAQFFNKTNAVLANYETLDPAKFKKVDQTDCEKPTEQPETKQTKK